MLFAIDCGNTHIVAGIYDESKLVRYWRLGSDIKKTEDEYMATFCELFRSEQIEAESIDAMIIASVVPDITFVMNKLARKYLQLKPTIVGSRTDTGITIDYDYPEEVGADRIVNAVAAHRIYGGCLIVVDFGTATTFDCVSEDGCYLGGAIAPGIEISKRALFEHAAKLANIPLERPEHVIGKNTTESLQSGILWGFASQVDGIVARMSEELAQKPRVIATGGLARIISAYSESIDSVNPLLTLEGLRFIYERGMAAVE